MIRVLIMYLFFASSRLCGRYTEGTASLLRKTCNSQKFMGAVAVAVNGKIVFSDACGWADAEWNVKNTVDTVSHRIHRQAVHGLRRLAFA